MEVINRKKFWKDVDKDLEGEGCHMLSLVNLAFIFDEAVKLHDCNNIDRVGSKIVCRLCEKEFVMDKIAVRYCEKCRFDYKGRAKLLKGLK